MHELILERRAAGAGVVIISEDLDELVAVSDRIAVLHDGHVAGICAPHTDRQELGRLMLGARGVTSVVEHARGAPPLPARRARLGARRTAGAAAPRWWVVLYLLALVIFGAFALTRHVDPLAMYHAMWEQTIASPYGCGQVIDKAAPFALAALAVAVPARAGLVNIGGEGQIVLGATAAGGVVARAGHAAHRLAGDRCS